MDLTTFHSALTHATARGYRLNANQQQATDHPTGPLWIIAGPGTGKSEVLVTRTLRLLCVDGVEPGAILLTTFTEKAARNLEDRLASSLSVLQSADPTLNSVDLADLRVGTLHSLCNDILQEYRFPGYQNVRLLDDVEQHLLVYRHADIATCTDVAFWRSFHHAVSLWRPTASYPPNKWQRTKAAVTLLNHIVEDGVDVSQMAAAGGEWLRLAEFYEQYYQELKNQHRCDFAHLQSIFLEFIGSPAGTHFLKGDATKRTPALQHVLVDEYQDTNPIQERIYLQLASESPHNITVVGDDDQALYRFRGGTVACMVNFDKACAATIGVKPRAIQLDENYRSHEDIVDFFNGYITSFPEMTSPGVRAPRSSVLTAKSLVTGAYPAVCWISRKKVGDLPAAIADLVQNHLVSDGVISDLSQCVLLLRSAKDSARNAGPFIAEFQQRGIPIYNPRSKSFMASDEVQTLLAALIEVIDVTDAHATLKTPRGDDPSWRADVTEWLHTLGRMDADPAIPTTDLASYIQKSRAELPKICSAKPGGFIQLNLVEILHRILAHEPFRTWKRDPSINLRLSKVTRLFESYGSFNLGTLRSNAAGTQLDDSFLSRFYYMFIGYLTETGIDDDEDDEVIVPTGYLPIMTIHQSKGLEFPFVIVAQVGQSGTPGAAQHLEHDLAPFRNDLYTKTSRAPNLLTIEDDIRLLYVAYSRAQYGLIIAANNDQLKRGVAVPGRDFTNFRRAIRVI